MKKYFNTKYITLTAMITAVLVVVSLVTIFIKIGDSTFQLSTGLYIALCGLIPGPSMLITGIVYGAIIDMINGGFIYIPLTIIINILIFLVITASKKSKLIYLIMILASSLVFLYIPYSYLINNFEMSALIKEVIVDSVQFAVSCVAAIGLYCVLNKNRFKKLIFTDTF
ncbi:hypothetical protein [Mesoplasma photuris]|uniref:hypothetical protein n=1 Tax=Mesoplasma photuris TaxID=217731 RepID=UPI0004E1A8A3|nr:hypothetical protein [Mesoplasma photuris]